MFNYNNLYTCGDQFLIDCYYSPYKEFKKFLERDPSKDYSHESSAFGAKQYPMWNNVEALFFYSFEYCTSNISGR